MNLLIEKFKEMFLAVLPITVIILILNFTIVPLGGETLAKFILGTLFVTLGLSLFLFGVEMGVEPIGSRIGETLVKNGRTVIFIISGFILGFLITVAEPDVAIYAGQVGEVTEGLIKKGELVIGISLGVGIMLAVGLVKIFYDISLRFLLAICYSIVFFVVIFAPNEFLGIPFDAAGATTGSMTVPFMLALGIGVSSMKINENSENDSFGLTACASIGPILSVLIMTIMASGRNTESSIVSIEKAVSEGVLSAFFREIPHISYEVFLSLFPIVTIFIIWFFVYFAMVDITYHLHDSFKNKIKFFQQDKSVIKIKDTLRDYSKISSVENIVKEDKLPILNEVETEITHLKISEKMVEDVMKKQKSSNLLKEKKKLDCFLVYTKITMESYTKSEELEKLEAYIRTYSENKQIESFDFLIAISTLDN